MGFETENQQSESAQPETGREREGSKESLFPILKQEIAKLKDPEGGFLCDGFVGNFIDVIRNPRNYASSVFGVRGDLSRVKPEQIDVLIKPALAEYVRKQQEEATRRLIAYMDICSMFSMSHRSQALGGLRTILSSCQQAVDNENWQGYRELALKAHGYLCGMEDTISNFS